MTNKPKLLRKKLWTWLMCIKARTQWSHHMWPVMDFHFQCWCGRQGGTAAMPLTNLTSIQQRPIHAWQLLENWMLNRSVSYTTEASERVGLSLIQIHKTPFDVCWNNFMPTSHFPTICLLLNFDCHYRHFSNDMHYELCNNSKGICCGTNMSFFSPKMNFTTYHVRDVVCPCFGKKKKKTCTTRFVWQVFCACLILLLKISIFYF